jgi:DNA-dependent RNA polymerase auxiliary subunit epsilon
MLDNIDNNLWAILSIEKHEQKVLKSVELPRKVSNIVKITLLPRSTVNDILLRLIKRKLIAKQGKFYLCNFDTLSLLSRKELPVGEISKIKVIKGMKDIGHSWSIVERGKGHRWQLYQSNASISYMLQSEALKDIINYSSTISKNEQTTELYIEPNLFNTARKILEPKSLYLPWLESLQQRNFVTYEIPKEVFYSVNDIFVINGSVFFTNYDTETSIEITQHETVQTIRNLLISLQNISKPINLNKMIEVEISKTKK